MPFSKKQEINNAKMLEIKDDIISHLDIIKSVLAADPIVNVQTLVDHMGDLGKLLSSHFDGKGDSIDYDTGLLATDLAEILNNTSDEFPKNAPIPPSAASLLNSVFDRADNLYLKWADSPTQEDGGKVHASHDDFRKGSFALFQLLNYRVSSKVTYENGVDESQVDDCLFQRVIAGSQGSEARNIVAQIKPLQGFLNEQGPLARNDKKDPLVKLDALLVDYENLDINEDTFTKNFNEIVNEAELQQNSQSNSDICERSYDEDDFDDGFTDTESNFDDNELLSNPSWEAQITLGTLTDKLQKNTSATVDKSMKSKQDLLKKVGLIDLHKAMETIDPENRQCKELNTLIESYTHGIIPLDSFKQDLTSFHLTAQNSKLNTPDKTCTHRKQANKFNPLSNNKTIIMSKLNQVNKALAKEDGAQKDASSTAKSVVSDKDQQHASKSM